MRSAETDREWLAAFDRAMNQFEDGVLTGASIVFGLLGMAEAIRLRNRCAFGEHDVYAADGGHLDCARCAWSSSQDEDGSHEIGRGGHV